MFPTISPFLTDYSGIERRMRDAYLATAAKALPVPSFTKTPKSTLNVGGDAYRISSGATYAVRELPREVDYLQPHAPLAAQRVELKVPAASFNAKQLRELVTHLNALASAMEATA